MGIIIAKRDRLIRECLHEVMLLHGYKILCICETGYELIQSAMLHKPALVLCGYSFEDMDSIDAIQKIKKAEPFIRFVVHVHDKKALGQDINLMNEIQGFIHSSSGLTELLECVKSVLAGGNYFRGIFELPRSQLSSRVRLSFREREILKKISEYRTSKEIAEVLNISIITVNNHKANIVRKLGLTGHNALLQVAISLKD